ncbi:XRE family transcriptional regulator [Bacillus sp. FJAT-42376]|uniref:helix-turn-helix domain-containing protein n=1 Tax=Bacillus sp. FJAT-42376 TaxID=2014076 RepID=UPI000F508068|nr:helix-turn-helix transcriptional regulator [Bacillus sp. FJAT-42376]AZB43794.1 XRE family transcriptional regulator [Bacillus sp. FJAT-42376]
MENIVKLTGERIRILRKNRGWTQEEYAEKADFQTSYIASVERGERNITLETLEKLLVPFNINASIFFTGFNLNSKNIERLITQLITLEEKEIDLINDIAARIIKTYKP